MQIKETFVNGTKGYQFGQSDWYEPFTDNIGRLFLDLQREYGRCVSKMYREHTTGGDTAVGWVFQKRMVYDDARSTWPQYKQGYVREVWVEVRP